MITDPLFYLVAIPAVTLLGLGKGGFVGFGMIATPLVALVVQPLEGAAILLPILICRMPSRYGPIGANGAAGICKCCCPARSSASARPGCSQAISPTPRSS